MMTKITKWLGLILLVNMAGPALAQTTTPPASTNRTPATLVPLNSNGFRTCVDVATNAAIVQGAPAGAARAATAGLVASDPTIIEASSRQPESRLAIWDYLATMVDDERVSDGQVAFGANNDFLRQLGTNSGVNPATVAAIWGVETNYGRILGGKNVLAALSTLGCRDWNRRTFFNSEFVAAIRIVALGHVRADHFVGSWAGAFGQTQFMPSAFWSLATDGNGDGIKNIIDEPADALASTANFLRRSGWVAGQRWGYEVRVPANYAGPISRTSRRSLSAWNGAGLRRTDGTPLPSSDAQYGLIFPGGRAGPGFLVGRNFEAVRRYNPSDAYALAVNLLADRISGEARLVQPWPVVDAPLSRVQRRTLQAALNQLGYDAGAPDGLIGPKTMAALTQFGIDRHLDPTPDHGRVAASTLAMVQAAVGH